MTASSTSVPSSQPMSVPQAGAQRTLQAPTAHTLANFSSLISTVVKTTGVEVPALVGSSTTIVNDVLYVFGGRLLSRTRPALTSDMYALDLITREWSQVETKGDVPPPRYFHSVCALGDTKLVCFGGMSPTNGGDGTAASPQRNGTQSGSESTQSEVVVMSDIHIYDIPSQTWTYIPTTDPPEGRYAHCATILPSSAVFTTCLAPAQTVLSPRGLDSAGGAEMVIVGGQNSDNLYIEEINVFNLRSCKWTSTRKLDRFCGAYRSVVSPLPRGMTASMIGAATSSGRDGLNGSITFSKKALAPSPSETDGNAMLIYSNYNFLDVRLELQVRLPDGTLVEKPLAGPYSPPGLRFPNGGVIDSHFVVSGTYLTSSKQEYALWSLDLRTLVWSKIDVGNIFSQGSWNRGILWSKRNTFLILGKKDRSLVEDYNQRRINFNHLCMVTLEAYGLYDNPRMNFHPALQRSFSTAAQELGRVVLGMRDLADMELLAVGGERVPVNSRIIARRWGPYFVELLNASNQGSSLANNNGSPTRLASLSLPTAPGHNPHHSTATITPQNAFASPGSSRVAQGNSNLPSASTLSPLARPRTLYLPHTHQTLLTLVHYLYTSTLPPPDHPQSSPQILCSLLQLARPYRVEGLLEAVVERLHQVLDLRNAAAVFNAAAMAAGGGASTFRVSPDDTIQSRTITPTTEQNGGAGTTAVTGVDVESDQAGSSVIGLQKRGLKGLMEGKKLRERGKSVGTTATTNGTSTNGNGDGLP